MKKLITSINGGFPLVLDDIRWMNQGFNESVIALASPYVKYSDVAGLLQLSGFETTVNTTTPLNHTIGSGYILINDEIYFCAGLAAHNVVDGYVYRVKVVTEYDATGNKLFQSGMRHDTYAISSAQLIYEPLATPTAGSLSFPQKTVLGAIYDYMQEGLVNEKIHEISGGGRTAELYAFRDSSKICHLSGTYYYLLVNTLILEYRPIKEVVVVVPIRGAWNIELDVFFPVTEIAFALVKIAVSGDIQILQSTGNLHLVENSLLLLCFDNISYL